MMLLLIAFLLISSESLSGRSVVLGAVLQRKVTDQHALLNKADSSST